MLKMLKWLLIGLLFTCMINSSLLYLFSNHYYHKKTPHKIINKTNSYTFDFIKEDLTSSNSLKSLSSKKQNNIEDTNNTSVKGFYIGGSVSLAIIATVAFIVISLIERRKKYLHNKKR
ncbi:MAG: hypothetical protein U9O98_03690 [Asgard group archaeon]|nr:hypothetical protein [Asgard group archaeon]